VSRRASAAVVCAVVAALAGTLLDVVPADGVVARTPARHGVVSVPAYVGPGRLRATLPVGGMVSYRLPALPDGAQRVLGDWNGDGAQTTGIFDSGQWQLWNDVVRAGAPDEVVTFGQPGDRPVTGDWNGDGITDIGVVRGSEWILALGPLPTDGSAPAVWRDLTFGDPGGVPVVGDWNGDGADGIGTYDAGHWLLTGSVVHPTTTSSVTYGGVARDVPVTGDWNGDGRDGIGVVRGSTWYLSDSATSPRSTYHRVFARSSGEVAVTWRVPTAGGYATCPTRRTARVGNPARVVPPTAALDHDVTRTVGRTGRLVRGSLEQSEKYLLGARYAARWRSTRSRPYLSLLGRPFTDELAIRLPAMSALAVAIGLRTDAANPAVLGRSPTWAGGYVDHLVRSIACEHEAVSPGGWGLGWQTAHWAMLTGAAAWLVWDELSPETRSDVTAMLVAEADRQLSLAIPYWGEADGTIVSPGDTKAEEDAWNAELLYLASVMMPSAAHAPLWRAKAAELAVAAYSTQSDLTSSVVVNGVSLADRLQGFNAYPDGTVENHDRIHPDYANSIQLLWQAADFARLAGVRVPQALFHHGGLVYSALSTVQFQAGAPSPAGGVYAEPGGTVYVPGTDTIYYPQGDDWGTARRAHWVSLDAHALVYAKYLHASGWPAADALDWHERGQRALWRSSGAHDGRTYSINPVVADQQDTYPGREEYAAENLATAWLALYVGQIGVPRLDTGTLAVPAATRRATRAPASAAHTGP
jgi:hypothetical protein